MPQTISDNRVLHLIDSAGMYGAERVVVTLLAELKSSHFPGILGCIRENDNATPHLASEATSRGIPVHYFTMARGLNPLGILRIRRFIRDSNIAIVHAHGYKPDIFLSLLPDRRIKRIATVHGWAINTAGLKMRTYEFLDARALKKMDRVIAVSQSMKRDLIRRGLTEARIETIYNGINCDNTGCPTQKEDISLLRHNYGISNNDLVIGSMGRLTAIKGHAYLIQAMPSILKELPHAKLLIAGDGPLKKDLEAQIKAMNLDNHVKLIGYINDCAGFFPLIDLFVLPSLSEGLPITLLEAMAWGKPVVATAVGGIPEVITSYGDVILTPSADIHALSQSVIVLLKDKDTMRRLSTENRALVENNFSAGRMADEYKAMYLKLWNRV